MQKNIVNLFKNSLEVLTDPNKNLSEKEKRTKKPIPIKVTKKTDFNIIINEYYILLSIIYEMSSLNVLSVLIRENMLCFDLKYYYFLRRKGNWFNEL